MVFCWGWFKEPLVISGMIYHYWLYQWKNLRTWHQHLVAMSLDGMSNWQGWQGQGGQLGRVIRGDSENPQPQPVANRSPLPAARWTKPGKRQVKPMDQGRHSTKKLLPKHFYNPKPRNPQRTGFKGQRRVFTPDLVRFPVNFLFRSSANCGKTFPFWNNEDIYLYIETDNYRQSIAENSRWLHSSWKERKKERKEKHIYIHICNM